MVFIGKDASKMANIAMCEIYGKITEGDNVYLEDIKTNLTARYPKKFLYVNYRRNENEQIYKW